jgi:hypothetical protein
MRTQNVLVPARDWQETDLYFAIARVGDSAAGEAVWRRFTAAEVIPGFPSGFTIVPAIGTWREQTGAQSVLRSDHAARVSF